MKRPNYPVWLKTTVVFICLVYISGIVSGIFSPEIAQLSQIELFTSSTLMFVYVSIVFLLLSALFVLREKESLNIIVLLSSMVLFFETIIGKITGVIPSYAIMVNAAILLLHFIVLVKLSYMCFGALAGGGNYKKLRKHKKK